MKTQILTGLTALALGLGCATTPPPPQELVAARNAYERARSGPASQVALVDLHATRQHLDRAEQAYRDEPESQGTRDLAYIALRRAEITQARANTLVAQQQLTSAEQQRMAITGQRLESANERLAQTQSALQQQGTQLSTTQQQLSTERAGREDAERQLQAAMRSLQEVAAVREEQRGTVITLSGEVLFAPGQSTLLPIAQERLQQVANALREQGQRRLIVEGHTDSRGPDDQNHALSVARANAVRGFLITHGLNPSDVEAVGMGESRPVATNDSAEGRANNRRVEIVVGQSDRATASGQRDAVPMASQQRR